MTSTIPPGGRTNSGRIAMPFADVSSTMPEDALDEEMTGASATGAPPAASEAQAAIPLHETRRLGSESLFLLKAPAAAAGRPDDQKLSTLLCVATGAAFDRALAALHAREPSQTAELLQETIARLAGGLHPGAAERTVTFDAKRHVGQLCHRLESYLIRLRIVRLLEAFAGPHTGELVYPFSGYDVLPSLVYPNVTGIDWKVGFDEAPVDPSTYRKRTLLRAPDRASFGDAVLPLEQKVVALYDAVASEPSRYRALAAEVFDGRVARGIRASQRGRRTLFLKGLNWMIWPQKFLDDLLAVRRTPEEAVRQEDLPGFFVIWNYEEAPEASPLLSWLADHYTQPGDLVSLWGTHPKLAEQLAVTGRYAPYALDFLEPELRARIEGDEGGGPDIVVDPIENAALHRGALALFLPSSLQLLRRLR